MKEIETDYIPYGEEWERAMNKRSKSNLIDMVRKIQLDREQYVIKARHKDAYDTLNALEEISIETDPIGATEGYIKAWKKHLAELKKGLT